MNSGMDTYPACSDPTFGYDVKPSNSSPRDRELILVKHAVPDIDPATPSRQWTLSERGKLQCEALFSALAHYEPSSLFTSEEPKAVETAAIVGAGLGISPVPSPDLHENDRTDLPFAATQAAFNNRMKEFFLRPSERVIGRESADEAHSRFAKAVRKTMGTADTGSIVIVTHGAVATLLTARANQLNPYTFWLGLEFASFVVLTAHSFALRHVGHPARP